MAEYTADMFDTKKKRRRLKKSTGTRNFEAALARLNSALSPSDLLSPTLDNLNPQAPAGEIATAGNKEGNFNFTPADQAAAYAATSPRRTQEAYTSALWNDSAGNPDSRFGKFENNMLAEANPTVAQRGLERVLAGNRAGRATNIAQGITQRQIRATGIRQDSDEAASMQRQFGLARVLNRVDAQNNAMKAMDERRDMVRDYSFDAEGNSQNAIAGGLSAAAASEQNRQLAKKGLAASTESSNVQMAGQAIGLAISAFSHSSLKEAVVPVQEGEILDGLLALNINRWKYKGEEQTHVGPMAEEFQRIFGVGDGVTLQLVDVMGVALGALRDLAAAVRK